MPTYDMFIMQCGVSSINIVLILFEYIALFSLFHIACMDIYNDNFVVALVANKQFIYLLLIITYLLL